MKPLDGDPKDFGRLLPLPEERRRIVAVAQRRLRAARQLLSCDDLPRVDVGTSSWPPVEPLRWGWQDGRLETRANKE